MFVEKKLSVLTFLICFTISLIIIPINGDDSHRLVDEDCLVFTQDCTSELGVPYQIRAYFSYHLYNYWNVSEPDTFNDSRYSLVGETSLHLYLDSWVKSDNEFYNVNSNTTGFYNITVFWIPSFRTLLTSGLYTGSRNHTWYLNPITRSYSSTGICRSMFYTFAWREMKDTPSVNTTIRFIFDEISSNQGNITTDTGYIDVFQYFPNLPSSKTSPFVFDLGLLLIGGVFSVLITRIAYNRKKKDREAF